jgi:hypothetical protein
MAPAAAQVVGVQPVASPVGPALVAGSVRPVVTPLPVSTPPVTPGSVEDVAALTVEVGVPVAESLAALPGPLLDDAGATVVQSMVSPASPSPQATRERSTGVSTDRRGIRPGYAKPRAR